MKHLLIPTVLLLILFSCDKKSCANIPELGNSSCIDSTLIVSGGVCITVYEPVCGCNGVTYSNSCVATTKGGVSSYVDGECCD